MPPPTQRKESYLMRNFRAHNPEKGMVHPRKRSRKRLITSDSDDDDDDDDYTDKDYTMEEDASKQLVLYDPQTTRRQQREFQLAEPIYDSTPLQQIPPKTKAREWNRVLSCNDPEDMSQDGSKVWAIDKPNIAQTPLGWDREVRIRGEGCSKFADVYYTSPAGVTLRSMVEIERYLAENPFYVRQGVYLGQFSFATPKPLEEGYVRKRKYSATTHELPGILEPVEVNPLCWATPPSRRELLPMGALASNPVDLDGEPEVFEEPPMHTSRRNLNQAAPSSSGRKKRAASSGEPRKRTMKQASASPPMHTSRRNLNQAAPSSSGRKKRAASSGEPRKRTMKQASASTLRPPSPPSWPRHGQSQRFPSDVEHVLL